MCAKFRIYPPIGIARLGNGPADRDSVIFSPEVPWANLYETEENYRLPSGAIKKQAQRFYIFECDDNGQPIGKIDPSKYDITWTAEVANKKPFWYDFNNSLDLSVQTDNLNLSPNFFDNRIAPGIDATYRNPNVLDQSLREPHAPNYRKELVNSPSPVSVSEGNARAEIVGSFPFSHARHNGSGISLLAKVMDTTDQTVPLGTLEYDNGTLIFYGADGTSASLNPSDLNTDFADNSNWYDDICDGRITAVITDKATGDTFRLEDAESAAWVATTPPDYAPQIQPISTMYDLINGADKDAQYTEDFSLIFPVFYRLYRMQWVNLGDFLSPSFRETIDQMIANGTFKYLYTNDGSNEGAEVRRMIFQLFRNPLYDYNNEPVIPSKEDTDLTQLRSGTTSLKLPTYPGDGINYPGSPAQWFAIPPVLYQQLERWKDGEFATLPGNYSNMYELGLHYQQQYADAAQDPAKVPLLMTRAVLETLYGGGFHPGVELTWPMRHAQMYAQNTLAYHQVTATTGLFGLREVRLNTATAEEQAEIFYNDFGFQINANEVADSMNPDHENHWLWKSTPGDLTKWMGIPWQSDAGSCQAVFTDSQYPVPAWWAANLPVDVLTEDTVVQMKNSNTLPTTRQNLFATRLPWLKTADTGYVGYHAEGGYMNGLIAMVYQWKNIGMVTGRTSPITDNGIPEMIYVSFDQQNRRDRLYVYLGQAIAPRPAPPNPPSTYYRNTRETIWLPEDRTILLSSTPDGLGEVAVDDAVQLFVSGNLVFEFDFSQGCTSPINPHAPFDITDHLRDYVNGFHDIEIAYRDLCRGNVHSTNFYMVFR